MEYKKLGKSDVTISEIVLGCWAMGGDYFSGAEDERSIECVHASLDSGVNTFDTAELYGKGRSEEVLGKALQGMQRDKYVLIDKAWVTNFKKADMENALETSMKRMGVDYVDVYFLHYPPRDGMTIEEAMGNILALKKAGKIRAIGVSNFSLEQLQQARQYGEVDVVQPCYSLLWRYDDRDVIPYCEKEGIGVIPYSTLAQGLLTGTMKPDAPPTDGRKGAALFQPGVYEKCLQVAEGMRPIAEKYGKTIAQTAINWLACTPGITAPIVGGSSVRHATENAGAVGWQLSAEDYAAIDALSRGFTDTMPEYELFFNSNIKK